MKDCYSEDAYTRNIGLVLEVTFQIKLKYTLTYIKLNVWSYQFSNFIFSCNIAKKNVFLLFLRLTKQVHIFILLLVKFINAGKKGRGYDRSSYSKILFL